MITQTVLSVDLEAMNRGKVRNFNNILTSKKFSVQNFPSFSRFPTAAHKSDKKLSKFVNKCLNLI